MISDATVDCYNESEAAGGLFCMLEQNLAVPFATTVLELKIVVERVDLNDAGEIVAVCRRGNSRQRIERPCLIVKDAMTDPPHPILAIEERFYR